MVENGLRFRYARIKKRDSNIFQYTNGKQSNCMRCTCITLPIVHTNGKHPGRMHECMNENTMTL